MSEIILNKLVLLIIWRLALISNHYYRAKQETTERIKSILFLDMCWDSANPIMLSCVNIEHHYSGPYATTFFICPACRNKSI